MDLTILGVNSPYPRGGHATLGYLVRCGATGVLLDAGCGIYRRLAEDGHLAEVDGIIQSHLHYDHCADLPAIVLGATVGQGRAEPLAVLLPPGETERLQTWFAACGFTFALSYLVPHELSPGTPFQLGELRIMMAPARHSLPGGIITVTCGDKRLVYTGDTADCDSLRTAVRGADLLLAEVTHLPPEQAAEKGHLPAPTLGALAAEAGVGEVVVTHFMQGADPEALRREVEAAFGRPVRAAHEGQVIRID